MSEIDEETIARAIVGDLRNGTRHSLWVSSEAQSLESLPIDGHLNVMSVARAVLSLVLPAIERARVEEREANGWHLSAFDDEALFSCLVNGETVASVSITKADGIAYAYKRKRGGHFVPGQIAEPLNAPQAFAEDLFDAVAAAIRKG